MYAITTKTGTVYTIENGRITRSGDSPIVDRDGNPTNVGSTIVAMSFTAPKAPVVGRRWTFFPKGSNKPIQTSRIKYLDDSGMMDRLRKANHEIAEGLRNLDR